MNSDAETNHTTSTSTTHKSDKVITEMNAYAKIMTIEVMKVCGSLVKEEGITAIINDVYKTNSGDAKLRAKVFEEHMLHVPATEAEMIASRNISKTAAAPAKRSPKRKAEVEDTNTDGDEKKEKKNKPKKAAATTDAVKKPRAKGKAKPEEPVEAPVEEAEEDDEDGPVVEDNSEEE